jgi:hypothetical protein
LPIWRKKSPRPPARSLRRQRKQRPAERRPRRPLLSSQGQRSRLGPVRLQNLPLDKPPRRRRQQLNNHRRHLLLPYQPLRHEHTAL